MLACVCVINNSQHILNIYCETLCQGFTIIALFQSSHSYPLIWLLFSLYVWSESCILKLSTPLAKATNEEVVEIGFAWFHWASDFKSSKISFLPIINRILDQIFLLWKTKNNRSQGNLYKEAVMINEDKVIF